MKRGKPKESERHKALQQARWNRNKSPENVFVNDTIDDAYSSDSDLDFSTAHSKFETENVEDESDDEESGDEEDPDEAKTKTMYGLVQQSLGEKGNMFNARYDGTSKSSIRRHQLVKEKEEVLAVSNSKITSFFSKKVNLDVNNEQEMEEDDEHEMNITDDEFDKNPVISKVKWGKNEITETLEFIKPLLYLTPNARVEKRSNQRVSDHTRMLAVHGYLSFLDGGMKKMPASSMVARSLFAVKSEATINGKSHCATNIRKWGESLVLTKALPIYKRGQHKTSVIHDEDIQESLKVALRLRVKVGQGYSGISPDVMKIVAMEVLGKPINSSTSRLWLKKLGWKYRTGKGSYFDGHERPDIQEDRALFVKRWAIYEFRFLILDGEDEHQRPRWLYPSQRILIAITHDECITRANDTVVRTWLEDGKNRIASKHPGQSLMISAFVCACHGLVNFVLLKPGVAQEGWWTNELLVNQVVEAMPLAESMHPGADLLFMFDNSANHHAVHPTGLNVTAFNLNEGGKNFPTEMRNGWYMNGDERIEQSMYVMRNNGVKIPKGLTAVLSERSLIPPGLKLTKEKASEILRAQPDFKEQREWLAEVVLQRRHSIDYYPKYHCELSFIEKVWSFLKERLRKLCDYTFKSLEENVPTQLGQIPIMFYAKAARSCSRYILAYGEFNGHHLTFAQVQYAHKKYSSHRRITEAEVNKAMLEMNQL